uniref:NUP160 middle TPR domain-containing protein n=1 Tax=Ditylenchus dipsaci TaxID=166011 RepID=A0A915D6H4_9BILA
MWIALSVRLVSQRSSERKYGGHRLSRTAQRSQVYRPGVDGEGDEGDDDDEDDIMGFRPVLPPSKWDETSYFSSPSSSSKHQRPVKEKPFESFVREVIAGSIITLWPESTSLTLPRFLAENGFFDALKNYCSLNEPFVSELAYALRFFQGISYSGLGKPEIAWKAFEEISLGVLTGDDALNSLLGLIMYSNDTQAITEPKKHSLAEYYNEVMLLFKAHGHTKYVILAGDKAVQCAKDNDPLLQEKQSACLRQLLTFLVDSGDTRTLVDLSYDHLTDVVVDILETRCRSDSVSNSAVSDIYDVVFAFHGHYSWSEN